jgi:hypothetical protein
MKKRKSKTKKGRSPSMAVRVKQTIERVIDLENDLTALKRRVADLENAKTEDNEPIQEPTKSESIKPQTIV